MKKSQLIFTAVFLSGLSAPLCVASAQSAAPLISRDVLFGNPERAGVQISPDGSRLSYLAPVNGVMNVWVGPVNDLSQAGPVTHETVRGVRNYFWAFTNEHILHLQDVGGDENWRLQATSLTTGETKDLTPFEGVAAQVVKLSPLRPQELLIGLNTRSPQFHDVYRVNVTTGNLALVEENPGVLNDGFISAFVADENLNVRLAQTLNADGGTAVYRKTADGWTPLVKAGQEDSLTTAPVGFDLTGRNVYMLDSVGRDTAGLYSLDVETGERALLADDVRADAGGTLIHPTRRTVQAVSFEYERVQWRLLDRSLEPDFRALRAVADGDITIASRTLDDSTWIVAYVLDAGPARYYRYDRAARQATFLFTNRPALEGQPLATMRPVVLEARDGFQLVSYLTLPVGADAHGDGAPEQPTPMVLLVHGGPWGRDSWGYNPLHQWLANRGYSVLSVNFRGSTGFGKAFVNAGDMEWSGAMHDDLLDAVQWAVKEGVADESRVAIMGGSYGGYATLVGLTFTPETFACGVDIVGPSNLVTLLESIPPYWKAVSNLFRGRMGDNTSEEGRTALLARSPISRVDAITKPLLIGQGANDPRVNQAESDQIVRAMQSKQIPVTYVLYPDEGHGFARPENNKSFFAVTELFLAAHLGGRYEQVGDDFEGSSITIPVGADGIPGLEDIQHRD